MTIRMGNAIIAGSNDIDEASITTNSLNKIQASGVIDQNSGSTTIKSWIGTLAEYNTLIEDGLIDSNTLYNITDDINPEHQDIQLNNPFSLLDYKYSEYELNNASWLLSNGQFNSGSVYQSVYDLLLQELNGTSSRLPYKSYINTVGSLVNTDGVLSGFSASSYATLSNAFSPNSDTWEIVLKIKTGSNYSSTNCITRISNSLSSLAIDLSINTSKQARLSLSSNGSSWNISQTTSTFTFANNTDYFLKLNFTGSQYVLSYSLDGESYIDIITVTSSVAVYASQKVYIGCVGYASTESFSGTINLNESYININGERWWTGRRKIITNAGDYTDTDFVINTTDTTFRLPIKVLMAGSKRVAGNGMALGLTNGTVNGGMVQIKGNYNGLNAKSAAYGEDLPYTDAGAILFSQNDGVGVTTDPEKSGIEVSSTGLYLYFYVGETIQDANIIAAAGVLTDVANLKNASNFSQTGLSTLSGLGMPSDRYEDLTLGASGATYTAPANGWFSINKQINASGQYIAFYKLKTGRITVNTSDDIQYAVDNSYTNSGGGVSLIIPVKKNDIIYVGYNAGGNLGFFRFIYAEGEN